VDIFIEIPARRRLALDRRSTDSAGRLTVTDCVITASQVNDYLGREVPGAEALDLSPDRIYRMYRCPEALKAATPALNGQPLMLDHIAVSAADPQQQRIIGTVSDARWDGARILATISVWDGEAIRLIETNTQRDISAGYAYVPDMTPGSTPSGERYDGVMRGPLEWNHIALVGAGRVSGAQVADSALNGRAQLARLIPNLDRLP
jgi:hypothetical protein